MVIRPATVPKVATPGEAYRFVQAMKEGAGRSGEPFPPCTNRGGKPARLPPHPATECPAALNTHIDYLSFTFRPLDSGGRWDFSLDNPGELARKDMAEGLPPQVGAAAFSVAISLGKLISYLKIEERDYGMFGYRRSFALLRDGQQAGFICWGGNQDTVYVTLSGTGTALVDMSRMHAFIKSLPWPKLTRVDIAHDDVLGRRSIAFARDSYLSGGFTCRGRPPSYKFIEGGALVEGRMVPSAGSTFYVGNRANGKQLRAYEKGKQLGDLESPWVRWELELHNVDREIPLDVLLRPDHYMAGAFPCLSFLAEGSAKIETLKKTAEISLVHLKKYFKVAYGRLVYVLRFLGQTAEEIVQETSIEGVPKRLVLPVFASS